MWLPAMLVGAPKDDSHVVRFFEKAWSCLNLNPHELSRGFLLRRDEFHMRVDPDVVLGLFAKYLAKARNLFVYDRNTHPSRAV